MEQIFSDSFYAMGIRCDVVFTMVNQSIVERMFVAVKDEVEKLNNILNHLEPDSSVSKLNKADKSGWISIDDELWDYISVCFDFYQISNGAFDVSVGALTKLWANSDNPESIELENAINSSGFENIELDIENKKIRFLKEGVLLDFGAVLKGFALDNIKPLLLENGITNSIISLGERSVLALGTPPSGEEWPLGIWNNYDAEEFVHVFSAKNEFVTTSGFKPALHDESIQQQKHVISPESGLPVEENITVSIKSESAALGGFLSTIWLILPENDRFIVSEAFKNLEILEVDYSIQDEYKTKLTIL